MKATLTADEMRQLARLAARAGASRTALQAVCSADGAATPAANVLTRATRYGLRGLVRACIISLGGAR